MADKELAAGLGVSIAGGVIGGLMRRHQREKQEEEAKLANQFSMYTMALKQAQESGNPEAASMIFEAMAQNKDLVAGKKGTKAALAGFLPLMKALGKGEPDQTTIETEGVGDKTKTTKDETIPGRQPLFQSEEDQQATALQGQEHTEETRENLAKQLAAKLNIPLDAARARMKTALSPEEKKVYTPGSLPDRMMKLVDQWKADHQGQEPTEADYLGLVAQARKAQADETRAPASPRTPQAGTLNGKPASAYFDPADKKYHDPQTGEVVKGNFIPHIPAAGRAGGAGQPGPGGFTQMKFGEPLDRETMNVIDPRTGMTPVGIRMEGIHHALTGKFLSIGMGGSTGVPYAARQAVIADGAALAARVGKTEDQLQSEFAGLAAGQKKLATRMAFSVPAGDAAINNFTQALEMYATSGLTGGSVPTFNRLNQYLRGETLANEPAFSELEVAIYSGVREYVKVVTGSSESVAGIRQGEQEKVDRLLNAAMSPGAFVAAIQQMRKDIDNVNNPLKAQSGSITGAIGQLLKLEIEDGGGSTPPPPPTATTPKVNPFLTPVK